VLGLCIAGAAQHQLRLRTAHVPHEAGKNNVGRGVNGLCQCHRGIGGRGYSRPIHADVDFEHQLNGDLWGGGSVHKTIAIRCHIARVSVEV